MEIADEIEEVKVTCLYCNRKATINMKLVDGQPTFEGPQVQLGCEETYVPVCHRHFREQTAPDCFQRNPVELLAPQQCAQAASTATVTITAPGARQQDEGHQEVEQAAPAPGEWLPHESGKQPKSFGVPSAVTSEASNEPCGEFSEQEDEEERRRAGSSAAVSEAGEDSPGSLGRSGGGCAKSVLGSRGRGSQRMAGMKRLLLDAGADDEDEDALDLAVDPLNLSNITGDLDEELMLGCSEDDEGILIA